MHKELENIKEKVVNLKDKIGANSIYIIGLTITLLIGLYVRTRNLKWLQGKYLLGLDPYCYYRYAGYILEHGKLMAQDVLRYSPAGYEVHVTDSFFSHLLAYGYKLIAWTGLDRMNFHIWYPAIAGLIGFVFLFLFVRELFGNKIALVSTAFAAVIPGYVYRTGAGFADHEALAMVWLFASLWLFARAWKSEDLWKSLGYSAGSGLMAGFLTLTWGGYKFLIATVGVFMILNLILSKLERKQLYTYLTWCVLPIAFLYLRVSQGLILVKSYEFLLLVFAGVACAAYLLLRKTDFSKRIRQVVPLKFFLLAVTAVIGLLSAISTGLIDISRFYGQLLHPTGANRLAFTVSENAQPFFFGGSGWYNSFGPVIFIVLAGAILLFYNIFKGEKTYAGLLTFGWVATLITFIFGRYRSGSSLNSIFSNIYLCVFAAFVLLVVGTYIYTYRNNEDAFDALFNVKWELLLLLSWFTFSLVIARGAVRTIMALIPVAAIVAGYFVVKSLKWLWSENKKVFAVLFGFFVIFCFVSGVQTATDISGGSGSGYPGQWENAMNWIKTSTPEDSVIAHWWDYGYWTQTMGERASVVDGGNAKGWDHQLGRYGLLGREPENYLSYHKTHEVTHLLVSEEEIGKFHAFSTVGSDENFDLRSTIGIFSIQQEQEVRNGSRLIYGGAWPLDKDYIWGNQVLKQGSAYVIGFKLDVVNGTVYNSHVALFNGKNQYDVPLKCICQNGECRVMNEDGFGGCLILAPQFISSTEANPVGAGFFVSEKVEDTLLVRLYLKGEKVEHFNEVYNDNTPLGMYQGRMIGPIQIWEMDYPAGVEADEKYLERSPYG